MCVNANKQSLFLAEQHGYAGNCRRYGLNICLTGFFCHVLWMTGKVWATFCLFLALSILFSFNLLHLVLALPWQCPSSSCSQQPLRCKGSPGSKCSRVFLWHHFCPSWQPDKEKRCLWLMVWMCAVFISETLLAERCRGLTCSSWEYWAGLPEVGFP